MDSLKFFHRRSNRLKGYDYSSPGSYFVTICTHNRKNSFGRIEKGKVQLNEFGRIGDKYWKKLLTHFSDVEIDTYVVMPNHVHAIITLAEEKVLPPHTLPELGQVVAYYKYQSTKNINLAREKPNHRVWQRSYFDHIIRNNKELRSYQQYILENPLKWELDEYFAVDR